MIDVHLKGAFHVGRPAFRAMKTQGYGRLLFKAFQGGLFGSEGSAAYGAAKAGLLGVMYITAAEGLEHGIYSNLLMQISKTRLETESVPTYMRRIRATIKTMGAQRAGAMNPSSVALLAVYLVSRSCTSTHAIYTAGLSRYARVFVGLSEGWFGATEAPADIAKVAAHFSQVAAPEAGACRHS
jgi:NAD(P)-dependent dehydrogenase (short-subunit alcohol dehydrogenase family)